MQFYSSYREMLRQDLEGSIDAVQAKQPRYLPTVLTKEEISMKALA
ncbi:MAG: hypothetical protein WBG73_08075 [Coleofasciculaceae cyanobacterium]